MASARFISIYMHAVANTSHGRSKEQVREQFPATLRVETRRSPRPLKRKSKMPLDIIDPASSY